MDQPVLECSSTQATCRLAVVRVNVTEIHGCLWMYFLIVKIERCDISKFQIAESMGFKGEFRQWEHPLRIGD